MSNSWVESAFQIHLLQLSDGRPHPLATVDPTVFNVDYGQGNTITKLTTLISKHRLVVVVAVRRDVQSGDGGILVWDWRNGLIMLVSVSDSLS
jgi:hypothetical protein